MEDNKACNIITALHNGDEKALSQLYHQLYGPLYYYVLRIVDNTGEAQEITADSFLKYWKQREDFESLQNIKAFLYVAARNACFDLLRDKKKQASQREHLNYFLLQNEEDAHLNDEVKASVLKQVQLEIENLPHQCRKIFKLSFLLGYKNAEIAEQLDLTIQTVKNQKTRAVKMLKTTMTTVEAQLLSLLLFLF